MPIRIFNVKKSTICSDDRCYSHVDAELKNAVDLRPTDSPVDDQGVLGSCSANALVNVYENMILQSNPAEFEDLSRLFIYYNSRVIEETVKLDVGVMELKSTLEVTKDYGVCNEKLWPYDISTFATKPSEESYNEALKRKIQTYEYIKTDNDMIEVLSLYSKPVLIAMHVFEEFMHVNKRTFTIPLPKTEITLGGHAVSVVGYTETKDFIIKNSFGAEWGNYGYAILPKEYAEKYVFDRWHFNIFHQN